ncbi:MAG TPA: dipeptidase [Candidatus Thermoplasmatota archaeon]|nr:dipeptidase [Candidatus Thermoplasmatota archaeon]
MDDVVAYLRERRGEALEELKEFLRIPSVSAQPKHAKDVERAAQWVADALRRAGMPTVEVAPTAGHPIVYAEWLGAPGAPTLLLYGHYDVQPPEPLDLWKSPPFEPTERGGDLYARGATDDKGQVFAHVKAIEAHLRAGQGLPVNVKVVIEGEEEVGSKALYAWLDANRERLACDFVVISDTAMHDEKHPAITYALRGLVYYQVDVRGPSHDLHSGIYGGAVRNPAEALVHMLASMKDAKTGRIKIPGFYDDVRPPTRAERNALARLPWSDRALQKELGVKTLFGEKGWTSLERMWLRPTFEINGVYGGYTGDGAKTVIGAEAHAKVSMRLVAGQTPEKTGKRFKKALKGLAPSGVEVKVTQLSGGMPCLVPADHPAVAAGLRALEKGFGMRPVLIAEGGSIPIVAAFERVLGAPSVLLGFGLHDEGAHSPNERFRIAHFEKGMEAAAWVYHELAAVEPPLARAARKK